MLLLPWLLAGAVLVEESSGVSVEERARLLELVAERVPPAEAVSLRLIGIPGLIRVELEQAEGGWREHVDLTREPSTWPTGLGPLLARWPAPPATLAAALQPERAAEQRPRPPPQAERALSQGLAQAEARPGGDSQVLPWALLGGGLVLGAAGVAVGVENHRTVRLGERSQDPARVAELQDRAFATGLSANVLYALAAAGVATGVVLLLSAEP